MTASAPPSDPAPKLTNYLKVADELRRDIVGGALKSGTRLKLHDLAERYAVSPQPVREALQLLQGEGLVVLEPNRGAHVRGLDINRLRHIYELREAIEGAMSRRFAEEAALSDIRKLDEIQARHDAAIDARDLEGADKANLEFHRMIVNHSGNEEAIALRDRYFSLTNSLRHRFGYTDSRWEAVRHDHHELLDAFRRRDGMAAYAVASGHVRMTMDELLRRIADEDALA
jgi:DNA-binding GntR family transcriptional regulator